MTAMPEASSAELRATVLEALQRTVAGVDAGYAALLRHQLRDTEVDDRLYGPAVFCLGLGRLITGEDFGTLPEATALGLLEEMGRVFIDLETPLDDATLTATWGMPRTLNSADGFYALAQQALIDDEALSPQVRLNALGVFSEATRAFSEDLPGVNGQDGLAQAARKLYPAAVLLVSLCCDLDDVTAKRLAAVALELAAGPGATLDGALQKAASLNLRPPQT
jgi:hypothetical protein